MSPLSCAQLFKSRVKGGHRQLDKQPTPRQIASLFGAPLANMLHMFRGSLAAGAIFSFLSSGSAAKSEAVYRSQQEVSAVAHVFVNCFNQLLNTPLGTFGCDAPFGSDKRQKSDFDSGHSSCAKGELFGFINTLRSYKVICGRWTSGRQGPAPRLIGNEGTRRGENDLGTTRYIPTLFLGLVFILLCSIQVQCVGRPLDLPLVR